MKVVSCKLKVTDIVRLCFENPNHIFSLGKDGIEEGVPVNIAIVDPQEVWTLGASDLHSKCGWTPYERWTVRGRVKKVIA
jgi:dihydroorotase